MALTKISGSIIKDSVSLSGNVSVGGTLTYQDVTNVDALGIGTFRTGIKVLAGQVDVGNNIKLGNAGVITATSFVGSGANLTGITQTTINSNTNNYLITGTGTANTIQGEANLTFDGDTLLLKSSTDGRRVSFAGDGTSHYMKYDNTLGGIILNGYGGITFETNGTNERLRIASNGGVGIATDKIPRNYFLHIAAPSQDYTNQSTQLPDGGGIMFQHTDTLASTGRTYPGIFWSGNTSALGRARAGIIGVTASNNDATHIAFLTRTAANGTSFYPSDERVRITNTGQLFIGTTSGSEILCIKRDDATGPSITLENDSNKAYINNWGSSGGGSGRTNRFEINATSQAQASYCAPYHTFMTGGTGDSNEKLRIHSSGTLQAYNHATSRNGIVQINQVTSTTRYSGSIASVDLITGSTFTPKTSAPRFLIMIFCPVNTSDDSDAIGSNTNPYHYGRIEYRKSGGGWIECDNQGSTSNQGGYAAHIELSPNRTGADTTGGGYWSGNRYRMEHKQATVLVTNVGDCGSSGTVQFKLRGYSHSGSFVHIGQPHGYGTDDNYAVQPWGFTVFELAPDNNSYTAY